MDKLKDMLRVMRIKPGEDRRLLILKLAAYAALSLSFIMSAQWAFWILLFTAVVDAWFLTLASQNRTEGIAIMEELIDMCEEGTKCVSGLLVENQILKARLSQLSPMAPNNMLVTDKYSHDA